MKKYTFLIFILFTISSNKIFAQFEFYIQANGAFSLLIPSSLPEKHYERAPIVEDPLIIHIDGGQVTIGNSYSGGVLIQTGNAFGFQRQTGLTSISLLADIGYYMQTLGAVQTNNFFPDVTGEDTYYFHTINVGVLPKFNFTTSAGTPFSLGIGYGIKIPLAANNFFNINTSGGVDERLKLSYSDITEAFDNYLIQYVKITADWYIYVAKKSAITLGLYFSYDFGMNYTDLSGDKVTYYASSLGISIGYYFGRANPK